MSRELGVSSYEGDVTEEATKPLLIELTQDSWGMGWVRHLCRGWHDASLDSREKRPGRVSEAGQESGASETREINGGQQLEAAGQNLVEGFIIRVTEVMG